MQGEAADLWTLNAIRRKREHSSTKLMLFDLSLSISCEERVRERIVFVLSVLTDTTMQRESEVPKEENI